MSHRCKNITAAAIRDPWPERGLRRFKQRAAVTIFKCLDRIIDLGGSYGGFQWKLKKYRWNTFTISGDIKTALISMDDVLLLQ